MRRHSKILFYISGILLILISLLARYEGLKFVSFDMLNAIFPWYEYVQQHGFREALGHGFLNYTYSYPYLYLIALASKTSSFLNRGTYTKLFGFLFDVFSAYLIFKIVFHKHKDIALSFFAGALFFTLPTIVLNSGYWGQADNTFTAFLLCCVYFVLTDRPVWATVAWGAAFSFKLQAIFLLPFLLFCILIKKMKWWQLLFSALTFFVFMIPVMIAGRPFLQIFYPYIWQAGYTPWWSLNAANIYVLFLSWLPKGSPDLIVLPIVGLIILAWVIWSARNYGEGSDDYILGVALGSVAITAYLLPHMHERYFYPADVLSLAFAFYVPQLYVLPIFFQISSYLVYRNYLYYDFERAMFEARIFWAAVINLISILILLGWQYSYKRMRKPKPETVAPVSSG